MVQVKRKPGHCKEHNHQEQHLDGPPPRCQSSDLLLLCGGTNMSRTPQVRGDGGVGYHRHQKRYKELDEEHTQGYPSTTTRGKSKLEEMS